MCDRHHVHVHDVVKGRLIVIAEHTQGRWLQNSLVHHFLSRYSSVSETGVLYCSHEIVAVETVCPLQGSIFFTATMGGWVLQA